MDQYSIQYSKLDLSSSAKLKKHLLKMFQESQTHHLEVCQPVCRKISGKCLPIPEL